MAGFVPRSIVEQLTEHLREQLLQGRWSGLMPGKHRLAEELGVNNKTVEIALGRLERDGWLVPQGAGRRRRIAGRAGGFPPVPLSAKRKRIGIIRHGESEGWLIDLQHRLVKAGHESWIEPRSLLSLRMKVGRVAKTVGDANADAWIVVAGSGKLLGWFLREKIPVMAVFGRRRDLSIAGVGPDKAPAYADAVRRLLQLGHARIVLLTYRERRLPEPGASERAFVAKLEEVGIQVSAFHLPDWDETAPGLRNCLEGLFSLTPPTAMIIDGETLYFAVQQFLLERGLQVPEDVSLVCTDDSEHFVFSKPSVAHIRWDRKGVVRRVMQWADRLAHEREDRGQTMLKATFVEGDTIGPAST